MPNIHTASESIYRGLPFSELWVLEYSESQQAFHTQSLLEALKSNITGFCREGRTGDYVILGVFEDREAADQFYNTMVTRMKRWGLSDLTVDDLLKALGP